MNGGSEAYQLDFSLLISLTSAIMSESSIMNDSLTL